MRPSAQELAMRDPAMAALMGLAPLRTADTFGGDDDDDDFGEDDDWGVEFGSTKAVVKKKPTPAAVAQVWQKHTQQQDLAMRRQALLDPNKGSAVKVGNYALNMEQSITLGTAAGLALNGTPALFLTPNQLTMNAPTPGFATISDIKVLNTSLMIGSGSEDAFNYNPMSKSQRFQMPPLTPQSNVKITGAYSGYIPTGYVAGAYLFTASFKGWGSTQI